jgi:hypothetical protein
MQTILATTDAARGVAKPLLIGARVADFYMLQD